MLTEIRFTHASANFTFSPSGKVDAEAVGYGVRNAERPLNENSRTTDYYPCVCYSAAALLWAALMIVHSFTGVTGISMLVTPIGFSASIMALI